MSTEIDIHPIVVPKWGLTMEEGTLVAWHIEEGQSVAAGDELLEIETSKIANAVEATHGGVLRRRVGEAGQSYRCGALLGVIAPADALEEAINAYVARHASTAAPVAEKGVEPEMLEVEGRSLRILRQGNGDVPIVFIHGFGGDLNNWLFVQAGLAERHATLSVDLPGHGGSGKDLTGIEDLGQFARLLTTMLAQLEIRKAHLVGHSLGAAITLAAARISPESVASLTLIAPAGLGRPPSADFIEGFLGARNRREMTAVLGLLMFDEGQVTRDMVNDVLKFKRIDGAEAALHKVAALLQSETSTAQEAFAGITAPVQVIWGVADRVIPADAAAIPSLVTLHSIKQAGHMPHIEQSPEVVRLIESWIGS